MTIQEQTDKAASEFALKQSNGTHTVERQNGKLVLVNVATQEAVSLGKKATYQSLLNTITNIKAKG